LTKEERKTARVRVLVVDDDPAPDRVRTRVPETAGQEKDIPVIMVTSLTGVRGSVVLPTDEYIPADQWLSKPVDPDTLLSRVTETFGQP